MLIDLNDEGLRMQEEIVCALGRVELLHQCAEECSELAIACSKVRRSLAGTTPMTLEQALSCLTEEAGDVMLLLDCLERKGLLDLEAAMGSARQKTIRWYGRTVGK